MMSPILCSSCENTGFLVLDDERAVHCPECFDIRLLNNRYNIANIDIKWRGASLPLSDKMGLTGYLSSSGEERQEVSCLNDLIKEFRDNIFDYGGLYFYGNTGRGKTFSAYIILNHQLRAGANVFTIKEDRLLTHAFNTEKENPDFEWEEVNLHHSDILLVDEVGATPLDSKDYKKNFFNELIRTRSDRRQVTILTSNLTPKQFGERNGRRAWSFLKESFVFLEFVSEVDHRDIMQKNVVSKLKRFIT